MDYGWVLDSGDLGAWDYQLGGAFAGSAVKRSGTYFLYYQGSCCYRIVDDSVTWRAIGVATSPDGINFSKDQSNPVVTWWPNGNGEEGAVSSAVLLDPVTDEVVLYYGANTEAGATTVNADGRLTVASDGAAFSDQGIVLDHSDPSQWGSGDELFPVIAFQEGGQWFVYYIPNGTPEARKLGVAWGPSRNNLTSSGPALEGSSTIRAWGMGGAAKIGPSTWALFLNDAPSRSTEVRTVSPSVPDQLSAPVETYQFSDFRQSTVMLDSEANTWFMYYRNRRQSRYGVKLAPVGPPDSTPPTAPQAVLVTPATHREADLAWDPASDSETGIVQYKVWRDGQPVATVKGWSYRDLGLEELTNYSYEVSAINYHGVEGGKSAPEQVTTPPDTTPPGIASVSASGSPTQVVVVFDEPVDQASAETNGNYLLSHDLVVTSAALGPDLRTVTLTTTAHSEHQTYLLAVSDIVDRAQNPNVMPSSLHRIYSFSSAPGLVGGWQLDEGAGTTVLDSASFGADGSLVYPGEEPAVWSPGKLGGALDFDGLNDLVTIPAEGPLAAATSGSHTFAAWAKPADVPPDSANNNTFYSLLTRGRTGLYYDWNQRYKALISMSDGSQVSIEAGPFAPGQWHHVAMTVDYATGQLHLFVDGAEVSGSPRLYSGPLADLSEEAYYIGTDDPLVERWDYRFHGQLDEIRIYDRALSASETAALSGDPVGLEYAVSVARMGGGTGSVTTDPAGIDCGSDCLTTFNAGTQVTLTAIPDPGSVFAGWGGHPDCDDGSLTVLGTRSCTSYFEPDSAIFSDGFESGDVSAWSASLP